MLYLVVSVPGENRYSTTRGTVRYEGRCVGHGVRSPKAKQSLQWAWLSWVPPQCLPPRAGSQRLYRGFGRFEVICVLRWSRRCIFLGRCLATSSLYSLPCHRGGALWRRWFRVPSVSRFSHTPPLRCPIGRPARSSHLSLLSDVGKGRLVPRRAEFHSV